MKALVVIEAVNGAPSSDSLGVLHQINELGVEVHALICGDGVAGQAEEVARHSCAGVLLADAKALAAPRAEPRAALIADLARRHGFGLIALATSVLSAELAAQLAVRLNCGVLWGLTDLQLADGRLHGVRATHADEMRTTCVWDSDVAIALFRQDQCAPGVPGEVRAPVISVDTGALTAAAAMVDVEVTAAQAPMVNSLAEADVVVSGGRGLGQPENLELVRALADALGGATGVSLPLVDMGWAARSMQVGQTGTLVRPRLYVACGISGQIQHKIGMERSGVIVAINTDREAPIMKFCDLGIVGDLKIVLPALTAAVRKARDDAG